MFFFFTITVQKSLIENGVMSLYLNTRCYYFSIQWEIEKNILLTCNLLFYWVYIKQKHSYLILVSIIRKNSLRSKKIPFISRVILWKAGQFLHFSTYHKRIENYCEYKSILQMFKVQLQSYTLHVSKYWEYILEQK